MTIATQPSLFVFNTLSDEHDIIIAPDDRHAPLFRAGDLLVLDREFRAPQHGGFFAVEYQQEVEPGELQAVVAVQQCRRLMIGREEGFVLGASEPNCRRAETVDGVYDAAQFEGTVQGCIVGVLRDAGSPRGRA